METEVWTRNSFDVEAVRVTEENIREVATWCGGTVAKSLAYYPKLYIHVGTVQYNRHKETKVFVGEWILLADDGFKHYRDTSFRQAYQSKAAKREAVLELVKEAFAKHDEYCCTNCYGSSEMPSNKGLSEELTGKIVDFFGEE